MSNELDLTGGLQPFPYQVDERSPRRRTVLMVALIVSGVVAIGALAAGGLALVVYGFNPMADEWMCSDGEAPAGTAPTYSQCFPEGAALPAGYTWDPFGNRPMSYNCDKDGWMLIERPIAGDVEQDCVRQGTELPRPWHRAKNN